MAEHEIEIRRSARAVVRWLLFLFTVLLACPIRYWPLNLKLDNTWVFALNHAAAHGLAIGRDVVWTTGPLGYLVFPMDIGNNLAQALIFQSIVWGALIAILADLFFRGGFQLWNLVFFTLFFAMSEPLYWFNYMGLENLILMGALVLLVVERSRGGMARYVTALALIGVIPLIKITGAIIAVGALAGWLTDRIIRLRWKAWPQVALAATVPLGAFALLSWCSLPSWDAFILYLRATGDFAGNYSVAMSMPGRWDEWTAAIAVLIVIVLALIVSARSNLHHAAFCAALLAIPLLVAFKHGFVRQDRHIVNFFCFAGVALGLIALGGPLSRRSPWALGLLFLVYGGRTIPPLYAHRGNDLFQEIGGFRNARFLWDALALQRLRAELRDRSSTYITPEDRLDPAIRNIIQSSPVATLSFAYSAAFLDGLNLRLYPVLQRYSAFTQFLDELNAAWIRDQGPPFLISDWKAIDQRHPWVETPAMWMEIYRWYNTRARASSTVLLERRPLPRFQRLESTGRRKLPFRGPLDLPESPGAIFWTMKCHLNLTGTLRKLLFRVPEVRMTLNEREDLRIIPEVLGSPVMGNYLPGSLEELAGLLDPASSPKALVNRITFGGPGITSYGDTCEAEILRPAPRQ